MSQMLPDADARRRIAEDLNANLLVEAGAGSGKTTALVGRMVALIRTGEARVEQIAAVTFTRKAAAELRERFQLRLEEELRAARAAGQAEAAGWLDVALRDLDLATLGTIHAFCARLLREHPIEAGLDPAFEEISGADETRVQRTFWDAHLERLAAGGDALLGELERLGIRPHQLHDVFSEVSGNPDVVWPAPEVPRPDPVAVRGALERWLNHARTLLPREEPAGGWDGLQVRVRTLVFSRDVLGWDEEARWYDALVLACGSVPKLTLKAWGEDKASKQAAKDLHADFADFVRPDGPAQALVNQWYAHRYPSVLRFASRAATAYAEYRRREGVLTFGDLLMGAVRLLREDPQVRRSLSKRFPRLLVDEFQDTDPVQAEVMFLLASGSEESNWWRAMPRPGALFVVGDPKQSIYRFRRAEITIYNAVKSRFQQWDGVLTLTANFRSRPAICDFANQVFAERFPTAETSHQAAFARLDAHCVRPSRAGQGVFTYALEPGGSKNTQAVGAADAAHVAAWIAERIDSGERQPGDFLVLAQRKNPLAGYARELERRGVAVQVTGAGVGVEEELAELLLLLRMLASPEDPPLVLAVLTGMFFGIGYDVLAGHATTQEREGRWALGNPAVPENGTSPVSAALARLGRWHHLVQTEPADVAVERIVNELGLLPHAAAGPLGDSRAGALLFALDRIRTAALAGETSFGAILDTLQTLLEDEEAETPLEPGRKDVVRVMNLHKAKGLEAPVVVLAYPTGQSDHEPYRHVARPEDGPANGYLHVRERDGFVSRTIARPLEWEAWKDAEAEYAAAEGVRLLYVAGTRAMDELVVCRCAATDAKSPWQAFHPELEHAEALPLPERGRDGYPALSRSAADIMDEVAVVDAARRRAHSPLR